MAESNPGSTLDLTLIAAGGSDCRTASTDAAAEVLALFDQDARGLLRYVRSFGLGADDTEDVVQDVFLSLFRHVQLGRSRSNLRGWVFRVAHNLALKQRKALRRASLDGDDAASGDAADTRANPEEQAACREQMRRVLGVLRALPDRDRRCLCLRAEGLRYRDIAAVLGISLGAVSKSLTRALAKLERAAERSS